MITDIRHFRRRSSIEREVLQVVRGKSLWSVLKSSNKRRHALMNVGPDEYDALCFARLRELSRGCALEIMPIGAQYLSISELMLLRWLAEGQRHTGLQSVYIANPGFRTALTRSAMVLRSVGLFLPSRTLSLGLQSMDWASQEMH